MTIEQLERFLRRLHIRFKCSKTCGPYPGQELYTPVPDTATTILEANVDNLTLYFDRHGRYVGRLRANGTFLTPSGRIRRKQELSHE